MEKITDLLQKCFFAGLGAISLSGEKAQSLVDELVKQGQLTKEEGEGFVENAIRKGESLGKDIEDKVNDLAKVAFERMHIATDEEIKGLKKDIASLKKKIKELEGDKEKTSSK